MKPLQRSRRSIFLAMAVFLVGASSLCGQGSGPQAVSGQVVSARDGRPISGATVILRDRKNNREAAASTSDEDGAFHLDPVAAGKYRLTGEAPGYITAAYQAHEGFATAIVTGAGLATDSLRLELMPAASITGRLTDEAGDPVAHAQVMLYRETPNSEEPITRMRGVNTTDDGTFEMERLPAGRYYLAVNGTPWYAIHPPPEPQGQSAMYRPSIDPAVDVAYAMTFYPGAFDSTEAAPIVLGGGDHFTADMQLFAQRAMSVTLHGPAPNGNSPQRNPLNMTQVTRTVFGHEEQVMIQNEFVNGADRLIGLPPGQYHLRELAPGSNTPQVRSNVVDLTSGSVTLDVSEPVHWSSVTITLHPAPGGTLPTGLRVSLRNEDSFGSQPTVLDDHGAARFPTVGTGSYQLVFFGQETVPGIASVSVNGHPATDHRIRVTGDTAVEVTLAGPAVDVEGVVIHGDKPAPGSMVVLVPAGADTSPELFRRDQSNLDGSFAFSNVAPGNYLLLAIDDSWNLRFPDLAVLQPYLAHAIPVTLTGPGPAHGPIHLKEEVKSQAR